MSLEEALKRWSTPGDLAEMETLYHPRFDVSFMILGGPPDPREEAYHDLRSRLERALFDRLAHADLLSSATEEKPDPRNPRFLVHPSVYDGRALSYSRLGNVILGGSIQLWNVEIFEPDVLPKNVSRVPEWLDVFVSDIANKVAPPEHSLLAEAPSEGFRHDHGYAHVSIRGIEFTLNPVQAGIVRVLHQASLNGRRWVSREELRQETSFKYEKLSGVFRHMRNPSWRELITSDKRGCYRLNTY